MPDVLFNHYRGLVRREDAAQYWLITVLQELAEVMDPGKLVAAAEADGNVA